MLPLPIRPKIVVTPSFTKAFARASYAFMSLDSFVTSAWRRQIEWGCPDNAIRSGRQCQTEREGIRAELDRPRRGAVRLADVRSAGLPSHDRIRITAARRRSWGPGSG